MADSPAFQTDAPATLPAGTKPSTEEVTTVNGATVAAEHVQRVLLAFRTADSTAVDLPGDAANGLDVDVMRLPPITLDAATLAALETIQIGNFPATQPVSAGSLPLPTGAATDTGLAAILTELAQKLEPSDLAGLATAAKQDTLAAKDFATQTTLAAVLAKLSADPASQTTLAAILAAVDGLEVNTAGLATQTTLAALLTELQAKADLSETQPVSLATNTPDVTDRSARLLGHVTVDSAPTTPVTGPLTDAQLRASAVPVSGAFFQATQPVSAASLPLPSGAATEATLDARTGSLTETAPATDTASSALNGRLQRIAQRLTSLIALLPGSLGQKTKANSLAVTLASDQDALPVTDNGGSLTVDGTVAATQSGTWTVQPGNTPNTTAWKVDGSAVTQPVSGTVTTKHAGSTGANTSVASTTTTNTTLIAADANRFGLTIFNESTAILFVLLGAGTESATVYTTQIAAGGYYEVPEAFVTLRASGHWASANGSARITAAT